MANILYHSSRALNEDTSGATEFQTVDFEIEDVGRKLLKNSVYLEGELEVFSSGTNPLVRNVKIGTNNNIGFHSLFESFSVDVGGSNIQNINYYPRYVNIVNTASSNQGSALTPMSQAEGIQLTEEASRYTCQAVNASQTNGANTAVSRPVQFSIKPKIAVNSMFGDDLSFAKKGALRISVNLARNGSVFHGPGVVATTNYKIKNMRLKYITVIDDGKQGEIIMNSVVGVKQSINSEQANLSVKVPSKAVTGVVVSYISQKNETSLTQDAHKLENLPNLDEIVYLFSDSQAKFLTYNIEDSQDMLKLGIEALSVAGLKCKVNSFQNKNNSNVVHGLNFQDTVDLSNQKFAVNLRSSSTQISNNPRNVYMHFLTIMSM